ncbi:MAG: hypothetical protein K9N23_19300 [Akkermansiaceae bacterium]|nr:hypothetical protein [Akkermansiaceae bacterium]MCF7733842.1 hypothetical protein [Akkermansiaceae bacterium]
MNPPPVLIPATAPAAAAPAAVPHDFPDRMSPILVKELRQGLRQPTFVIAFLCLQGLLCIVVMGAVLSGSSGSQAALRAGQTMSSFLFVLLGIVILVAQPLRGLNALASEIKNDTLDLLLITRLSAWRITFGKWLGLVSQSALLVVAVLPYLIMRYYLGGMRLFPELMGLSFMFVVSISITAVMVGFSSTPSVLLRGLVAAGWVVLLFTFMVESRLLRMLVGSSSSWDFPPPATIDEYRILASTVLMCLFFGYYLLEMGATNISPAAENRSTLKRLLGVAMLAVLLLLVPEGGAFLGVSWLLVVALLVIDAVSERPDFTASVLRPFRRLGPLAKPVRLLLLPGWPSGLRFAGVLGVVAFLLGQAGYLVEESGIDEFIAFVTLWFACLLMPAAVRVWFLGKIRNPFTGYMVALIGMLVVGLVFALIADTTTTTEILFWVTPICPVCGFLTLDNFPYRDEEEVFLLGMIICLAYWVAAFVRSFPHSRRLAELDRTASMDQTNQ